MNEETKARLFDVLIGLDLMKKASNTMGESQGHPDKMGAALTELELSWRVLGCALLGVSPDTLASALHDAGPKWHPMDKEPGHTRDVLIACSDPWGNGGQVAVGSMYDNGWEFNSRYDDHTDPVAWCEIPHFDNQEPTTEEEGDLKP